MRSTPIEPVRGAFRNSLFLAVGLGLGTLNAAEAQTASDDNFTAIARAVPQSLGNVLDNDSGATNPVVNFSPGRGTLDLQSDGEAIYTPTASSICSQLSDSFEYQNSSQQNALVNIQVFETGVADSYSIPAGETLTDDVQLNDRLPVNALGDPVDHIDVVGFNFSNNGSVVQTSPGITNQTGQFLFTPDPGFSGLASFEYATQDDELGCFNNTIAEVLVTPVANTDTASIPGAVETCGLDVLANDLGSALSLESVSSSPDGAARIDTDGTVCFLPDAGFAGQTRIDYTLVDGLGSRSDGALELTVENQPPDAGDDTVQTLANSPASGNVLINDSDPNGDGLSVVSNTQPAVGSVFINSSGEFTYTPAAGTSGIDAFDYTVADGQAGEATAMVSVTIFPLAPDQTFNGIPGQALTGNLLDGAIGTGLSIIATTAPSAGNLVVQANGDFIFEPSGEQVETFNYTISDSAGNQASGTVTLGLAVAPVGVPGLLGAPLGLLALLLGWLGLRRLDDNAHAARSDSRC